ncbi:MAG TPA: porphobilinogen synthase [Alphaproteobacteria bacterium]|nr:porphobilinogen synthase [Alphaproteobacteria bacterium]
MSISPLKPACDHDHSEAHSMPNRPRRLRSSDAMRRLVRENALSTDDFIYPIFVDEALSEPVEVSSMPGVFRQSEKSLSDLLKKVEAAKVPAVMLFGVSAHKDHEGTDSFKKGGLMDRMVKRAKDTCPDLVIMADACFCEYTDHGHCGPLDYVHNDVDNDRTIANIARQAVIAAEAGADVIAPSGMMDGQVGAIREALDQTGNERTAILAYAAKYASGFYGPFRDAAGCSLGHTEGSKIPSNRKTYQMDPANAEEALREVALDIEQGADMVMVKPGLAYLDILYQVKQAFGMPTFVYNVSGEYAMIKAAARNGWLNEEIAMMEMLLAFKRAGADGIITYAALDAAGYLSR